MYQCLSCTYTFETPKSKLMRAPLIPSNILGVCPRCEHPINWKVGISSEDFEGETLNVVPLNKRGNLAPFSEGKIIESSFPNIRHLLGSKMIDDQDKLLGEQETRWMTKKRYSHKDMVIITEKVDGMNASVLRKGNLLYPLVRKGYDCRSNSNEWIRDFATYVENNIDRFMSLLMDGERLCGDWMIKTHTLSYKIPHEPFIVFDLIYGKERCRYSKFLERVKEKDFIPAGLVHMGEAMPTHMAIELLKNGY